MKNNMLLMAIFAVMTIGNILIWGLTDGWIMGAVFSGGMLVGLVWGKTLTDAQRKNENRETFDEAYYERVRLYAEEEAKRQVADLVAELEEALRNNGQS